MVIYLGMCTLFSFQGKLHTMDQLQEELQEQLQGKDRQLQDKDRQLQEKLHDKDRQLQEKLHDKDRQIEVPQFLNLIRSQ